MATVPAAVGPRPSDRRSRRVIALAATSLATVAAFALADQFPAAQARGADEGPDGVTKLRKTVEDETRTILRAAHPLGKYKDIAFDGYERTGRTYKLTYTIRWTGKEKKDFATTFAFTARFDQDDEVDELEIAVPKDTCPSKAFRGANIAAGVFRAQVKRKVTAVTDDKELLARIDKLDGDGLLAVWLKYAGRKPRN